jgi:hypothetical protein
MTTASAKVWDKILAAFPSTLPPQPVTTCDCEECRDVRANLGHLCWNEILAPALDKHFGSLPLLTDEAFQALLPAFLFRALDNVSDENKSLEWTLYALYGSNEDDEIEAEVADARLRNRTASFNEAQREAVRAFLGLMATAPELEDHHGPIAHALAVVWS